MKPAIADDILSGKTSSSHPPGTARIHAISGSTNYQLAGTRSIREKKMATLNFVASPAHPL